jgi:predicted TPR repeat methyltransferase
MNGAGSGERHTFDVRFPERNGQPLGQDEEWCVVRDGARERRVRFHNYHEVFATPGLYEYLFYRKLECQSPSVVCSLLDEAVRDGEGDSRDLTVLDLGAGNGMVGQELRKRGVESVVGVDIIPEAQEAADRDRPGVYEDYYVVDLTRMQPEVRESLEGRDFNCLTSVAALGFGDIPPLAFAEAFNLIDSPGWVAFNIKDSFLDDRDPSGFSRLLAGLVEEDVLEVVTNRRYRHRLSVAGEPLYYTAFVARKHGDIPEELLESVLASSEVS